MIMTARINPYAAASDLIKPLIEFGTTVVQMGLEPSLVELVKIRASQINGCAVCLHMHAQAARKAGETEERLYLLDAWRESPLYTSRERAALAWTEALTRLSETHAPDADYKALTAQFSAEEQVKLSLLIAVINSSTGSGSASALATRRRSSGKRLDGAMLQPDASTAFDPLRPRLNRIAYRMLGSVADAEDVVQEAFIRWLAADRAAVREPEAFLCRVVTRLSLDQMKSARSRRETYVGHWLPEPIVEAPDDEIDDDITLPLMMALERLSPLERAAFLLHDVFGGGFDEVAETIGRELATCRQLASRARTNVRAARPRYPVPKDRGLEIATAFFAASRSGDMQTLQSLLPADVAVHADGGGKRSAALRPIVGLDHVIALHASLARLFWEKPSRIIRYGFVNGLPGFVTLESDGMLQTTALEIEDGKIVAIYVTRNPDKLRRLGAAAVH
jgi:RNA polymerase sigma-70 factor, ECF subfamily